MTKSTRISLIALAALVVLLAATSVFIDRRLAGIPGFYVWKALSRTPRSDGRVAIDDVVIYYETYGERGAGARPVLVLHGGTGFIESTHYQIRALAGSRFVVAPDSRGHGRSTDGEGPLHYQRMADDMVALLDALDVRQVDIVGWSDGGIIGLILAMQHPARVGRLVTSGANYHFDGLSAPIPDDLSPDAGELAGARRFYQLVAPAPEHWPVVFGKLVHLWRTEPTYREADLARIAAPVLVVAGEFDSVARSHTEAMAAAIPNGHMAIIPGATHFVPLEDPTSFDAAMLGFLNQ
jgi:pimeloyl-ACP methyl ester carboxylesterase